MIPLCGMIVLERLRNPALPTGLLANHEPL
jgi:hypothetical protein